MEKNHTADEHSAEELTCKTAATSEEKDDHAHEHDQHHDKKGKRIKIEESEYQQLVQKAKECDANKDTYMRRIADFENARKRLERDKEEIVKFANESLLTTFLPVLDTLDHALVHGGKTVGVEAVLSGVALIKKQFLDVLKNNGVEEIQAIGAPFDPHVHEAMGTVHKDDVPPDTVVDVIRTGYRYKGRLLRAAWVRIATGGKETITNVHDHAQQKATQAEDKSSDHKN
jgi:molecular chaperone GrpE